MINTVMVAQAETSETRAKKTLSLVDEYKERLAGLKNMVKEAIEESSEYKSIDEEIRDLQKEKRIIKAKIMDEDNIKRMKVQMNNLRAEIKVYQTSLFEELDEYMAENKRRSIEDVSGKTRRIVKNYKIS